MNESAAGVLAVEYLIEVYEDGNASEFARKIGVNRSRVSEIRGGRRSVEAYIPRLLDVYPDVPEKFYRTFDEGILPSSVLLLRYRKENTRLWEIVRSLNSRMFMLECDMRLLKKSLPRISAKEGES